MSDFPVLDAPRLYADNQLGRGILDYFGEVEPYMHRPTPQGSRVSGPPSCALKAAYFCAAEVMRNRRRVGQPIPDWLRRHHDQLDEQFRLSRSRHESDCAGEQLTPDAVLITAKEAALMLGCSKRTVLRIATDLDGELIGGRYLFNRATVAEYAEEKRSA